MKKSKTPPPFSDEMQLLNDAFHLAIKKSTRIGELGRIEIMYKNKISSIKQCSNHYKIVKKMKMKKKGKDKTLILISAAVEAFLQAKYISDFRRINRLYKEKLKAHVNFARWLNETPQA